MNGQNIISGSGSFSQIGALLQKYRAKRIFLVCGKSFQHSAAMQLLRETGVEITLFDGFSANPDYVDLCKGTERFRRAGCDLILACGGGSAMDSAKCIRIFSEMPEGADYLQEAYPDRGVPLIAVPTTAGTGSESTRFAVIYRNNEKQSVDGAFALPSDVILDASLLDTLPYHQRVCTMLDALCQAIESYWSVHATERSRALADQAMRGICAAQDGYLTNTKDGNGQMLAAANLAGQAIHITRTTAPHAMSYQLTKRCGFPHGQSVSLALVRVWAHMIREDAEPLRVCMEEIAAALGQDSPRAAVLWLDTLNRQLGLKDTLPRNDIAPDGLAATVNVQRLGNHPTALTQHTLEQLYAELLSDALIEF